MKMKFKWNLAVVTLMTLAVAQRVESKRLLLRPLTSEEVYRILKSAGREDAVPEGRHVSHGIAAIKGFALGLKKGVGGALAIGGLSSLFNTNQNSNSNSTTQPQEICFSTRNLEVDDYDGDADDDYDEPPQSRHETLTSEELPHSRQATLTSEEVPQSRQATLTSEELPESRQATLTSEELPQSRQATLTGTTFPATTGTNTAIGTGTDTAEDDGSDVGTNLVTSTETNNSGSTINCIVIKRG